MRLYGLSVQGFKHPCDYLSTGMSLAFCLPCTSPVYCHKSISLEVTQRPPVLLFISAAPGALDHNIQCVLCIVLAVDRHKSQTVHSAVPKSYRHCLWVWDFLLAQEVLASCVKFLLFAGVCIALVMVNHPAVLHVSRAFIIRDLSLSKGRFNLVRCSTDRIVKGWSQKHCIRPTKRTVRFGAQVGPPGKLRSGVWMQPCVIQQVVPRGQYWTLRPLLLLSSVGFRSPSLTAA
jgi:hypothetical protein